MLTSTFNQNNRRLQEKEWSDTLCARDWKDPKLVQVGTLVGGKWDKMHDQSRRIYSENGLAPTIHTNGGGNLEPKVCIGALRGRNPDNSNDRTAGLLTEQRLEINQNGTSNALTTVQKDNVVVIDDFYTNREPRVYKDVSPTLRSERMGLKVAGLYTDASDRFLRPPIEDLSRTVKSICHDAGVTDGRRVRKLIPKECWRLMGFSDDAFEKARNTLIQKHYNGRDRANSQLYKQAGNSIVVDVLKAVFNNIKGFSKPKEVKMIRIFKNAGMGDCVLLKEDKDFVLVASPTKNEFVVANHLESDGMWRWGEYFDEIDDALNYFNKKTKGGR